MFDGWQRFCQTNTMCLSQKGSIFNTVWCWRLFQFLFIKNDLSMLEVPLLTQYSWCHLQHCGKIMAAAFSFCGVVLWPKQTVLLQKLSLWRTKYVLALHLLCVLWGCFQVVPLLHPQSIEICCWDCREIRRVDLLSTCQQELGLNYNKYKSSSVSSVNCLQHFSYL